MENFEGQFNNQELSPEEKLENFRGEIAGIKSEEMEKKEEWENRGSTGKAYNPHFDLIEPEFLSEAEMQIYNKVKSGNLSGKEFENLRGQVLAKFSEKDVEIDPEYKSVHGFLMYLGNIVNAQELRKQIEARRK